MYGFVDLVEVRVVAEEVEVLAGHIRDEDVFGEPYRFDIGRSPNPQIDRVEPAGPVVRLRSNFISGIKTMSVRIHPRDMV